MMKFIIYSRKAGSDINVVFKHDAATEVIRV
jgi:hypothetical protein